MNELVELQKRIESCADVYAEIREAKVLDDGFLVNNRIEIAALEVMGIVERNEDGVLSAKVEYSSIYDPVFSGHLRAHYQALKDEDDRNFDMSCDGYETYVHDIHPPYEAKQLADQVDSFDQFVELCVEIAERRMPADEKLEVINPVGMDRNVVARCVKSYDAFVRGTQPFDQDDVSHRALLISGIVRLEDDEVKAKVFKSFSSGETYDSKQQFAEQRKALVWGIPKEEAENVLGWTIAQKAKTGHQFMKRCAEAAAAEINAKRIDRFRAKLDAVGCP